MYKFEYTIIEMEDRTGIVKSFNGRAIAVNAANLLTALYQDSKIIITFKCSILFKVFGAPNNDTIIIKKERI